MLPYATVIVGARTQYVVKVDWEDYDFILQWPWTYAVSHPRHGGLDNRRVNDLDRPQLRWLTPKENMANQRGIRASPRAPRPKHHPQTGFRRAGANRLANHVIREAVERELKRREAIKKRK